MQKKRSKDSSKQVDLTAADALRQQLQSIGATQFRGHADVQGAGAVVAILKDGKLIQTAHEGMLQSKSCFLSDDIFVCKVLLFDAHLCGAPLRLFSRRQRQMCGHSSMSHHSGLDTHIGSWSD